MHNPINQATEVVFSEAFDVTYRFKEIPVHLSPHQALVRTEVSLVSPGTELAFYMGSHLLLQSEEGRAQTYPFTPGYSLVGEVLAVGDAVDELKLGDRVFALAPHASHNVLDINNLQKSPVLKLSDDSSSEHALFCRLAAICMTALAQARCEVGDCVVVQGLGLIGNLAAQLFMLQGATVIGLDTVEGRLQKARQCGLENVLKVGPGEDIQARIHAITGGRDPDIVVEATGDGALINAALDMVKVRGQVIALGSSRSKTEIDVYRDIHCKGVSLVGAHEGLQGRAGLPSRLCFTTQALQHIERGALCIEPLITGTLPSTEIKQAYDALINDRENALGIVLQWPQGE